MRAGRRPAPETLAAFTLNASVGLTFRELLLPLACVLLFGAASCADDDPDPHPRCEELCGHDMCPRDLTAEQCLNRCLEWHDLCPSEARGYVGCANSQFDVDFICDDGQTRLADGLCDNDDDRLRACLNDE